MHNYIVDIMWNNENDGGEEYKVLHKEAENIMQALQKALDYRREDDLYFEVRIINPVTEERITYVMPHALI